MSIYRSAVNNPVTTTLVFVAFMIFGVFSLFHTNIDKFPEFDANVIMVMSSYPGTNASDIETNLTKVLENGLNGVENLKEMSSSSKENISLLTLTFDWGTDIESATNDVRDKLDMISQTLPSGASTPVIFKFSADALPILTLSATAKESAQGLDKILDDKLTTPLARVPGVGTVSVTGAPTREINVYCDPAKLQAYGLSVSTVASLVAAENRNVPSGNVDVGAETFSVRTEMEFSDPAELESVVLTNAGGNTVFLRDVATVVDGSAEREQESYTNGERSAKINIQKQSGANTVKVVRAVQKELKKIQETLPADIRIVTVTDGSRMVINTINSLVETILITFLVVALVVFVFLGNWKSTFIIVLSIPVALLASLVYLYATGNTLNIISMSALSIAIGMVVDDAIVVMENISSHIARGEDPKEAAVHGTSEVGISVIASTLTMLCVFLPLTMVSGMAGIMFKQLGWIVAIIMIVSTTAALTFVPMLCSRMLKPDEEHGKIYRAVFGPIDRAIESVSSAYSRLISWALGHRKSVIWGAVGIFVATLVFIGPKLTTEFFPHSDADNLTATIELPVGTAQRVTADFSDRLYEQVRREIPEVGVYNVTYGQADASNTLASMQNNGTHILTLSIDIGRPGERERTSSEVADALRNILDGYPEIRKYNVGEGVRGVGGASTVKVELYGYSLEQTDIAAREIQAHMQEYPAFSQVILSRDAYTPEYKLRFDREKLARAGLSSASAGAAFSAAVRGSTSSYYREDGEEYDIRVRYAPEYRMSATDLENVIVYNGRGQAVRIQELGTISETLVPPSIERKDRERYITITGTVADGTALSRAVAAASAAIEASDIPDGLSTKIAGDNENKKDMFSDMIVLLILIVLLVYMVMASQFESMRSPAVIMFSVPFAFVGVLWGLWISGTALGVMGMIGIIILMGIVVKNGIVLIDYTILCRERGMGIIEASVTAARSRLRPILMTTLTTVLGMLPMALGTGEGAEMWRPLGMTVCWGLSISTLVTLVLIPTLYCVFSFRGEKKNGVYKL